MATSSHSSICIVEGSKETQHHPQNVWRPFSISVSVIGRILHPNVAMSHSCWSWLCIQFSFIPFSWNAVSDYWNFVHINSHKINLLNMNLRAINFIWVFFFFYFLLRQKLILLSAMKWTALAEELPSALSVKHITVLQDKCSCRIMGQDLSSYLSRRGALV